MLESNGMAQPLFMVTGACHGAAVELDTHHVAFGAVMQDSHVNRSLIMSNTGDISLSYSWDAAKFSPDFSIQPQKGRIAPGMEVHFSVDFHPKQVSQDIRYEDLRCHLDNSAPLLITLTGVCNSKQTNREALSFTTAVRGKDTRNVSIRNSTHQVWTIKPIIEGDYWAGAHHFVVEPQSSRQYELVYRPLVMTSEGKKHQGRVFFAFPDGNGLLINLLGSAEPPKASGVIQRDIPCKKEYVELLPVQNWDTKPQRFRVSIDLVKPDKMDPGTRVFGEEFIDVSAVDKKHFSLHFFAHKEGLTQTKVQFWNEASGEFQFFLVSFKCASPEVTSTFVLNTPVRQSTSQTITVHNPLVVPVTMTTNTNSADISLPPHFVVPPGSEGLCMFEYLPLKASSGEQPARISFHSSELGVYHYDLHLKARPPPPESALHFHTSLGASHQQTCQFVNYARSKAEYICKIDSSDFTCERTISAPPASAGGSSVSMEISYEPCTLGSVRATLTISSNAGGEYIFPLYANCTEPQPQGPFIVKAGFTANIPFKNVFPKARAFQFIADNPCFVLRSSSETIRPRKTHHITVSFESGSAAHYDGADEGDKSPRTGMLTVRCLPPAGSQSGSGRATPSLPPLTWIFYLKGIYQ